jgi:hypothetical protein
VFRGRLADTQNDRSDASRRTHKIPHFRDGIKSRLYLDMLVPTFAGEGKGVARYASLCDMITYETQQYTGPSYAPQSYGRQFIYKIRMQGHVITEKKKQR